MYIMDVRQKVMKGLWHIGMGSTPVNIYSQQCRALEVAEQVINQGTGRKVLIVGAGIAGLTCAAALLQNDVDVILLEKGANVVILQRGNTTRWLHPTIFQWPVLELRDDAELPFFNWRAGYARDVASRWHTNWEELLVRRGPTAKKPANDQPGRLDAFFEVTDIGVTRISNVWQVSWTGRRRHWSGQWVNDPAVPQVSCFTDVVYALGFGKERDTVSYWSNDDLDQLSRDGNAVIVISGCGDGGYTDFLRAVFKDFRHDRLIHDFFLDSDRRALKALSKRLDGKTGTEAIDAINRFWRTRKYVTDRLNLMERPDTNVILRDRRDNWYNPDSHFVNRLLVGLCLKNSLGKFQRAAEGVPFESRRIIRHGAIPPEIPLPSGAERPKSGAKWNPKPVALPWGKNENYPEFIMPTADLDYIIRMWSHLSQTDLDNLHRAPNTLPNVYLQASLARLERHALLDRQLNRTSSGDLLLKLSQIFAPYLLVVLKKTITLDQTDKKVLKLLKKGQTPHFTRGDKIHQSLRKLRSKGLLLPENSRSFGSNRGVTLTSLGSLF